MLHSLILGLTTAVLWGVADFLARFGARRVGAYRTLFFMQVFGFLGLTAGMAAAGGLGKFLSGGTTGAWLWAVLAGLVNAASSLALYKSFEVGVLAIVAPISASYPALTILLAIYSGESINGLRALGIAATLVGVVLAATSFASAPDRQLSAAHGSFRRLSRGVGWAIVASLGFGANFWLLGFHVMPQLGALASVWVIRVTTFSALALFAAPAAQSLRLSRGSVWPLLVAVGFLDTAAFVSNNLGLKTGHVSIVTVLASLYSAVTVLLAWLFLREKLEWTQWFGIVLIFLGVALVSR